MSLQMKAACEKCERAFAHDANAYICSYECTFCEDCAQEMNENCPNCEGELVRRPRRAGA